MAAQLQLFGGEADGLVVPLDGVARPDVYYAVPLFDAPLIGAEPTQRGKQVLMRKLGVLAYRFSTAVPKATGLEFRYLRAPELDKVRTRPGFGCPGRSGDELPS